MKTITTNSESRLDDRYLTQTEAARYLRVSELTLWRMRREGRIPSLNFGKRVLFDRIVIDDLVAKGVAPVPGKK